MKRFLFLFSLLFFWACGVNNLTPIRTTVIGPDKDPRYQGRVYRPSPYAFQIYNESRNVRVKFYAQYSGCQPVLIEESGPEEGSKTISFSERKFVLILRGEQAINGAYKDLGERRIPLNLYPSDNIRTIYINEDDFFIAGGRYHWIPYSAWIP